MMKAIFMMNAYEGTCATLRHIDEQLTDLMDCGQFFEHSPPFCSEVKIRHLRWTLHLRKTYTMCIGAGRKHKKFPNQNVTTGTKH